MGGFLMQNEPIGDLSTVRGRILRRKLLRWARRMAPFGVWQGRGDGIERVANATPVPVGRNDG